MNYKRVVLIVLDSLGIGEMPDAAEYGDVGSNTLGNMARAMGGLKLPNLGKWGLGCLTDVMGVPPVSIPDAVIARAALAAPNKDTTSGHWEMMGVILKVRLNTYPNGFPDELIELFKKEANVDGVLANKAASGTEVIAEYGDEHLRTGFPIVYTSADSVFQIACHEEKFGLERLYKICDVARKICRGKFEIGRIIARPFIGSNGKYQRTTNRHDYSLEPPEPTVLENLCEKNIPVLGIGKIYDIFAGIGVPENWKTKNNEDGIAKTVEAIEKKKKGLIFTNLVDFDMVFGHRNNTPGYANAMEKFDLAIPRIIEGLVDGDLLIITADHGNDPTTPSTDHCREYCPVIAWSKGIKGKNLGTFSSLADIGATIAENFGVTSIGGKSFLRECRR